MIVKINECIQSPDFSENLAILVKYIKSLDSQDDSINEKDELEIKKILLIILNAIGARGFLTLIGLRSTSGSSDILPNNREYLKEKFNKSHCE